MLNITNFTPIIIPLIPVRDIKRLAPMGFYWGGFSWAYLFITGAVHVTFTKVVLGELSLTEKILTFPAFVSFKAVGILPTIFDFDVSLIQIGISFFFSLGFGTLVVSEVIKLFKK